MSSDAEVHERMNRIHGVKVHVPELKANVNLELSEGLHVFYGLNGVGKSRLLNAIPSGVFRLRAALTSRDGREPNRLWFIRTNDWSFGHEKDLNSPSDPEVMAEEETDWVWDDFDFIRDYTSDLRKRGVKVGDFHADWYLQEEWTRRIAYWVAGVHYIADKDVKRIVVEAIREMLLTGLVEVKRTPGSQDRFHWHDWEVPETRSGWNVTLIAPLKEHSPATWRYLNTALQELKADLATEGFAAVPLDNEGFDNFADAARSAIFRSWTAHLMPGYLEEALLNDSITEELEDPILQKVCSFFLPPEHFHRHKTYPRSYGIDSTTDRDEPIRFIGLEGLGDLNLWDDYIRPKSLESLKDSHDTFGADQLLLGKDDNPSLHPAVGPVCAEFTKRVNKLFRMIFVTAPELRVRVSDPGEWRRQELVVCELLDKSDNWVPITEASDTQCRLATIALQLAMIEPGSQGIPILIIDEPERGLHRLAELHLRAGLVELEKEIPGLVTCVATHSPLFLRPDLASLHHVQRTNDGEVTVNKLTSANLNNARGLGISTTDLLQLTRTIVLVEGSHDEWVLNTLFGDEFEELGVRVLSIRGATKLQSAAEGQLLFDYTEANILVMLDNVDTEKCQVAWNNAIDAWNEQQGIPGVVKALEKTFPKKYSTESKAIVEFCRAAIEHGRRERISFQMLRKGDIEFYFDPSFFLNSEKFPDGLPSWATLRRDHKKASGNFKSWLEADGRAKFNRSTFKRAATAAKKSGTVPEDLRAVLEAIQRVHSFDQI